MTTPQTQTQTDTNTTPEYYPNSTPPRNSKPPKLNNLIKIYNIITKTPKEILSLLNNQHRKPNTSQKHYRDKPTTKTTTTQHTTHTKHI